jgi:hypothetical protein
MAGWTVRLGRLCMLALALLNAVPALAGDPPGPAASAPADSSEAARPPKRGPGTSPC